MPVKTLLFFFIIIKSALAEDQLVVVLGDENNRSVGQLSRYEKLNGEWQKRSEDADIILGRNGLGWTDRTENLKMEGDGKSPAGVFPILSTFGYDPKPIGMMPYAHADDKLICIDDSNDLRYNQMVILDGEQPKSFEWMHREDGVYRYGAVIGYNEQRVAKRGSCIFFHLIHPDRRPTSGCTAMEETALKELLQWLDPSKNPKLLQIPKNECVAYQKEFKGIECK